MENASSLHTNVYPYPDLPEEFIEAVIPIDKEKGWTSFDVVKKLRGLVRVKKVGHAGTLDPMATGLLICLVGKATKPAWPKPGQLPLEDIVINDAF